MIIQDLIKEVYITLTSVQCKQTKWILIIHMDVQMYSVLSRFLVYISIVEKKRYILTFHIGLCNMHGVQYTYGCTLYSEKNTRYINKKKTLKSLQCTISL